MISGQLRLPHLFSAIGNITTRFADFQTALVNQSNQPFSSPDPFHTGPMTTIAELLRENAKYVSG